MSNTDNPYAAPESFHTAANESYAGPLYVEGDLICVGNLVHLPEICVISGETTNLIKTSKRLAYISPVTLIALILILLIAFVGPILFIILLLTLTKQTVVTMYVSREVRAKRRRTFFSGVVFMISGVGLFVGLMKGGFVNSTPAWLILPLVLFVVAIVLMVKGGSLLSVKKFEKPGNFWLRGFKPPFFATLAEDPDGIAQAGF
jgi:MFS family permease